MAAIDLLFDVKKDSERLHLLVLGALLSRTRLLGRLLPLPSVPVPPLGLSWEPEGKAYDLAITLPVAPGASAGGRVLVELRIDSALSEDQVAQQLNPGRFSDDDRLLYLLLGYSGVTTDCAAIRARIQSLGERTGRPDLIDRVSFRDAGDLIPLLADPTLWPESGPDHRDARDLAASYRDALTGLHARLLRHAERPVAEWQEGDYFGFYASLRAHKTELGLSKASLGRVHGEGGPAWGLSWGYTPLAYPDKGADAQLYLQLEGDRLSVKLRADTPGQRKLAHARILAVSSELGLFPEGGALSLKKAPQRPGSELLIAQGTGVLATLDSAGGRTAPTALLALIARAEQGLLALARAVSAPAAPTP